MSRRPQNQIIDLERPVEQTLISDRLISPALPVGPSEQMINAQLERILASRVFINAERLSRFLRFSVGQAICGQVQQLKEYSVAISVFDKRESFDPRVDPIVRVEAGRLRTRLAHYYETEGRQDAILIDLPKGSYVPHFVYNDRVSGAPIKASPGERKSRRHDRNSIAVLPFADHSPDRDQEYFCDGMTEELINALTKLPGLRVAAWASAARLRGNTNRIQETGEQLKVATVVAGSVRKAGDRVRITVQLIDTCDGCYLWSEIYDRELKDIFSIQEEISLAIVSVFELQLADRPNKHLIRRYTDNLDAYNLYLKGRYHWNQRSERSLKKGIEYFEQAIKHDPQYAPAYSGLADSYSLLGNYGVMPAKNVKAKAMGAARKAVDIDPTLAEAHTALGHVKATYDWDWNGARTEYEYAISLNPAYATVHHWYAITYLAPLGLLESALTEVRKAEELDPVSVSIKRDAAVLFYNARRYERAIEQCRNTLELDSGFSGAYWVLGLAYESLLMYRESVAALEAGLLLSPDSPQLLSALGHVYGRWNKPKKASDVLDRLSALSDVRYVSPFGFALIHLGLSDNDASFRCLEQAHKCRSYELVSIGVDPRFDSIRSDLRFTKLLKRLGLESSTALTV